MEEDRLQDLFSSIGPVRVTRMFGGQGIYSDGLIVAVVVDGELMMKADAECAPVFAAAGARQWAYERVGKAPVRMPYWSLPDEAYDDPSSMPGFAMLSLGAARRSVKAKSRQGGPRKRPTKTSLRRPDTPDA